jgi:hypothetical protein
VAMLQITGQLKPQCRVFLTTVTFHGTRLISWRNPFAVQKPYRINGLSGISQVRRLKRRIILFARMAVNQAVGISDMGFWKVGMGMRNG